MKRISITVLFIVLAGCEQSGSVEQYRLPEQTVDVQADPPPKSEPAVPPFPESRGSWVHSLDTGKKTAHENKRLIMIDFWFPECAWCRVLTTEVLNTDVVQKSLGNFNLVKINRDKNKANADLCKFYGVVAFPTLLFTDVDGNVVDIVTGGKHVPGEFAEMLDEIAEKGGRLAWYEKRISENPKNAELRYKRLMLLKGTWRWKQIEKDAGAFLAHTNPKTEKRYAEVLLLSGQSKCFEGINEKPKSAIKDLERFVSLFPGNKKMSFVMMLLAMNYTRTDMTAEAGHWYRRLCDEFPDSYHAGTSGDFFPKTRRNYARA